MTLSAGTPLSRATVPVGVADRSALISGSAVRRYCRVVGAVRLGIDLGTSNTVAVLESGDGTVRPVIFDGSELLPSAVFLGSGGELLTGRDALHAARAA